MKLDNSITTLPFVGVAYANKLEKLGISTVGDLMLHIPRRFLDFRKVKKISEVMVEELVTVKGEVTFIKNQYTGQGRKMQIVEIKDTTGKIKAVWFNQPYLVRSMPVGSEISLGGKVTWWGREKALISPEFEKVGGQHTGRLVPIYPETAGVSSKWLRARVKSAFEKIASDEFGEFLPTALLSKNDLISYKNSFKFTHYPDTMEEYEWGRERLAFNELLKLQLESIKRKKKWQQNVVGYKLKIDQDLVGEFIGKLPFELTGSQKKVVGEILKDLNGDIAMNRLLEGDVGSGKTVVAIIAAYAVFLNNQKTILMAPTLILAEQHFNTLKSLLGEKIKVGLVTGVARKIPEDWDILIGTHALLNKDIYEKVSLVVIDEQHRFGVEQRSKLTRKIGTPHVLSMTATPIPRTVAMTFYGDLELSVLDEMPKDRQEITTWVVPPEKREKAYGWVEKELKKHKSRGYVVCPLIEESDKETMKDVRAVAQEYESLVKRMSGTKLGLLHGKLKASEKSAIIEDFKKGKMDLLVSTPVIEVGVDVAEATIMVIEAADRFGLAQLHQLRGRVGRGKDKSYCLLMSESKSEKVTQRLNALKETMSGFELAELDLKIRGPGEIFGTKQSGIPELKIANWQDTRLIKLSKKVAESGIF